MILIVELAPRLVSRKVKTVKKTERVWRSILGGGLEVTASSALGSGHWSATYYGDYLSYRHRRRGRKTHLVVASSDS